MKPVRVVGAAYRDLARLAVWLEPKNPTAADRAAQALTEAIESLADLSDRGRLIADGVRELPVKFGRNGYVVRYKVLRTEVVVLRLVHTRERR